MQKVDSETIEKFLLGRDEQKYIVAIEVAGMDNYANVIINDPERGKVIEKHPYKPFLWFKEDITTMIYGGSKLKISKACERYGIRIKKLITHDADGFVPDRMKNGYIYLATCSKSYNDLVNFFKSGGVDFFSKDYSSYFTHFTSVEQFMIQTGKRLFKGMDDYDDLHRLQFDLETEGLFPAKHSIFQIGVRDNRGCEIVLEADGEGSAKRDSERINIDKFFRIIDHIKPDVITGYNSEDFDWNFIFERCERLGIPVTELARTLNPNVNIKRKKSTVKFGGETQSYMQTNMWGHNIIDISHAVRRAMAINSEIKGWGLKYITQYSEIAKPNRIYVPGDKINAIWRDKTNKYCFNDKNGDWYKLTDKKPLKNDYKIVTGAYIIQRYLIDDLWETEQIDNIFNQASFLIGKILPTGFQRSSTMGTAGQWKLLMSAWSYENGLAIPETQRKKDFTGGLSRLLQVGYTKNVWKLDYAALYPKTQLTHSIFPQLDISGVMSGLLEYVVATRDKFKNLASKEKDRIKTINKLLKDETLNDLEKKKLQDELTICKANFNIYDKKQLPVKILANSWFGSYGAPYIFNWGDVDSAEETTCRGRQYLRLMVKFFTEKYGFKALVLDTDGCNFSVPDNVNDIKYTPKGNHWKTVEFAGIELSGVEAALAEFNEVYLLGWMGLDIDDVCTSTINFSRKNYANSIGGKLKLVGNSIKSKKMPTYIEEFLKDGIRMLLDGDGYSFIQHYYSYVDKIYNYQIPLVKIASKSRVKSSIQDYKIKCTKTNKKGNPMPRQIHMELAIKHDLNVGLGDTIYYINTGKSKSHGDLKTITDKVTKQRTIQINSKLIDREIVEKDFEAIKELEMLKKAILTVEENEKNDILIRIDEIEASLFTDEYNVAKYLEAFNTKVKPLLVCFNPDIRDEILLKIVNINDKKNKIKTEMLKERKVFLKQETELVSGIPFKESDQDTYEELMQMEDKEIKFWERVGKIPNNMEESDWLEILADYKERMIVLKKESIAKEKEDIEDIIKHLEIDELDNINNVGLLPLDVWVLADLSMDENSDLLISRKWNEPISSIGELFKYEDIAKERYLYYIENDKMKSDNKFEDWLNYSKFKDTFFGIKNVNSVKDKNTKKIKTLIEGNKNQPTFRTISLDIKLKEEEDSEDNESEDEYLIDFNGELVRKDEILQLDDEIDDTISEKQEDFISDNFSFDDKPTLSDVLKLMTT